MQGFALAVQDFNEDDSCSTASRVIMQKHGAKGALPEN